MARREPLALPINLVRDFLLRQSRLDNALEVHKAQSALELLSVALEQEGFDPACRSLATELAARYDCERVSIGIVRNGHANVVAISHSAQFGRQMNLVRVMTMTLGDSKY